MLDFIVYFRTVSFRTHRVPFSGLMLLVGRPGRYLTIKGVLLGDSTDLEYLCWLNSLNENSMQCTAYVTRYGDG